MGEEEKIREILALIRLLDEPDRDVFLQVSDKIHSYGAEVIPFLDHEWESNPDVLVQQRAESLIQRIQFDSVKADFGSWIRGGYRGLLEACLIIARIQYPSLQEEEVHQHIAKIRKDVWLEINENLTALEQIKVFNHVFYETHGFTGNTEFIHSPDNSFINKVLETHKGNPLSIGIVYLLVAQSLDIPVFGVNLPEHFILAYLGNGGMDDPPDTRHSRVLFYINAFGRGAVFSRQEVVAFIERLGHKPNPSYFEPCRNEVIVGRLLNNLFNAFFKEGASQQAARVEQLRQMLKG